MEMSKAILSGSATALSLAKTLLTTPLLYEKGKAILAVPFAVTSYTQSGTAEVGESLIITADSSSESDGGKTYVTDNVAPGSWTWQLSGYIEGAPALELSSLFPVFVLMQRRLLKEWFKKGSQLVFKDIACETQNVVIQNLDLSWEPDCANKQPFSMTLKEINVRAATESTSGNTSLISAGGKDGEAANGGTTATTKVTGDATTALNMAETEAGHTLQ